MQIGVCMYVQLIPQKQRCVVWQFSFLQRVSDQRWESHKKDNATDS